MKEIHSLECPKKNCGKRSPLIYEDNNDEVFYCSKHGEFKISEEGDILWKKTRIVKKVTWKAMTINEL